LVNMKKSWWPIVSRGALFSLLWGILSQGAASSWWIGVPAVLLAVAVSAALLPPAPFVWSQFLRFMPFFFLRSLLGGADVAWRAFHPGMPIAPDLIEYRLRLPPGLPRALMASAVSLLPGTLSASLDQDLLKVHVLDRRSDFCAELNAVEQRVARVVGTSLKISQGGGSFETI
jgi:multicomponent Na+:H+ antiporter subunit E